jgi:hypothetical protein
MQRLIKELIQLKFESIEADVWINHGSDGASTISVCITDESIMVGKVPTDPERPSTFVKWNRYEQALLSLIKDWTWH